MPGLGSGMGAGRGAANGKDTRESLVDGTLTEATTPNQPSSHIYILDGAF